MKDNYRGFLSQRERWDVWIKSLDKPMGSYAKMRDNAENDKFKKIYGFE